MVADDVGEELLVEEVPPPEIKTEAIEELGKALGSVMKPSIGKDSTADAEHPDNVDESTIEGIKKIIDPCDE